LKGSRYQKWRGGGQYFDLILMFSVKSWHSENTTSFRFKYYLHQQYICNYIFPARFWFFILLYQHLCYRKHCQQQWEWMKDMKLTGSCEFDVWWYLWRHKIEIKIFGPRHFTVGILNLSATHIGVAEKTDVK
jgi:hypothetical protein